VEVMENFEISLDWANRDFLSILLGILSGLLIFWIGRWFAKFTTRYASRSMERAHVDGMAIRFLKTLVYIGVMAAVVIAALNAAGLHTTSLTALLASAGVAIGLALKDSLSNLASGVMILLFKPYSINHHVEAAGTSGLVEEVQIFNTVLRTPDNVKVIVPNSAVINHNISNYSAFDQRRVDLVISIGYDEDIAQARDILMDIMTAHPLVLSEPAPSVDVLELTSSNVNLAVRSWSHTGDYSRVRGDLLEQIKLRFDEAGLNRL
jgi:small conductance mechanosensitive channel